MWIRLQIFNYNNCCVCECIILHHFLYEFVPIYTYSTYKFVFRGSRSRCLLYSEMCRTRCAEFYDRDSRAIRKVAALWSSRGTGLPYIKCGYMQWIGIAHMYIYCTNMYEYNMHARSYNVGFFIVQQPSSTADHNSLLNNKIHDVTFHCILCCSFLWFFITKKKKTKCRVLPYTFALTTYDGNCAFVYIAVIYESSRKSLKTVFLRILWFNINVKTHT